MRRMDRLNCSGSEDLLAMPIGIFTRGRLGTVSRSAFVQIVRLDAIELLITDQLPEPELRDALATAEV